MATFGNTAFVVLGKLLSDKIKDSWSVVVFKLRKLSPTTAGRLSRAFEISRTACEFIPTGCGRKAAFANATACQGSVGKAEARFKKEEDRRLRATKVGSEN